MSRVSCLRRDPPTCACGSTRSPSVTDAEEDEPALWLHIEGKDVHWPEAPTSVFTALLDALRKGVQAGTEYIARGALGTRPTSAIRSACDFRIVGLQSGSLRVGIRLTRTVR